MPLRQRDLTNTLLELVNMVVLDAGHLVNLERFVPPSRQVTNIGPVGRRMPAHHTWAGKVLPAYLPEVALRRVLARPLEHRTPRTIVHPVALRSELLAARAQGYAVAQEELERGLNAAAVPICDHRGRVVAADSVAGRAYRVVPGKMSHFACQLKAAARVVSGRLGFQKGGRRLDE